MKLPISPKSAFAPIRYQATRPWLKDMGKLAVKIALSSAKKRAKLLQEELHPELMKLMRERLGVRDPRVFQNEQGNIQSFGAFMAYGRTIYEVSETLVDGLAMTEFEDVTQEDLAFPKGAAYLHLGDHPALNIEGVQYEGMFVYWLEEESLFSVKPVRYGAFAKKPLHYCGEDSSEALPVFIQSKNETIGSAIKASRKRLEDQRQDAMAQLEALRRQYGDADIRGALQAISGLPSEELYYRITSLALAVLCFLEARPEDIGEGYPVDVPADALQRVEDETNPGRKAVAERQLEKDGYLRVKYVGAQYAESADAVRYFQRGESSDNVKRILATHPRRGFFKRQPYGPGRSLRRIQYIAPTIVNPGGKQGLGHVFTVGEK